MGSTSAHQMSLCVCELACLPDHRRELLPKLDEAESKVRGRPIIKSGSEADRAARVSSWLQ